MLHDALLQVAHHPPTRRAAGWAAWMAATWLIGASAHLLGAECALGPVALELHRSMSRVGRQATLGV